VRGKSSPESKQLLCKCKAESSAVVMAFRWFELAPTAPELALTAPVKSELEPLVKSESASRPCQDGADRKAD